MPPVTVDRPSWPPIVGFAAFSGSGNTTLIKAVIQRLRALGARVGVIKHAHHNFDVDVPGKDSYELRKAGAAQTLVGSKTRWALMTELHGTPEPTLEELVVQLSLTELDLIIVEGFKYAAIPKLEVHRANIGAELLFPSDPNIIALITDDQTAAQRGTLSALTILDLNDAELITNFLVKRFDVRVASRPVRKP
jgi:molybdopterin-guanine dinucleotide biosynthesis protein MobB